MRTYFLLIISAIMLSFSTAYYALNLQKKNHAGETDVQTIRFLKNEFEKENTTIAEINLSSIYPNRESFQLILPVLIPSRNANFSRPCTKVQEKMTKQYFDKSYIWEDFRCHNISKLPLNFFESAPLIHESGQSYAYLAFLSGNDLYGSVDWVRSNLNYFHITELKELPTAGLDGNFKILAKLEKIDLPSFASGRDHFFTHDYYFSKHAKENDLTYRIFSRDTFENYFKSKNFFLRAKQNDEVCFYEENGVCFERDSSQFLASFKKSSLFIFFFSMVVLFQVAVILFKRIKQQSVEEERKKHALRVLTHELRTPIANLLLQVERINKDNTSLSPEQQEDFLKIEEEIFRLKRLAEKSRSYLEVQEGDALIAVKNSEVESINGLIQDLLTPFIDKGVQFSPATIDSSLFVDIYWLNVCLKNLVENALTYGKNPVVVCIETINDQIFIHVVDQGSIIYKSLDEILSGKRTRESSSGLGLGLGLVATIMRELNGKLLMKKNPTTFTLLLRKTS